MKFFERWRGKRALRKAGYYVPFIDLCTCFYPWNSERHIQQLCELVEILNREDAERERKKAEKEEKERRKLEKEKQKKGGGS